MLYASWYSFWFPYCVFHMLQVFSTHISKRLVECWETSRHRQHLLQNFLQKMQFFVSILLFDLPVQCMLVPAQYKRETRTWVGEGQTSPPESRRTSMLCFLLDSHAVTTVLQVWNQVFALSQGRLFLQSPGVGSALYFSGS